MTDNFLSKLFPILFGLTILCVGGCAPNPSTWYDYGNGKINLSQINFIKPMIKATLTLPEDPISEIGKNFSEALSDETVQKYKGLLQSDKIIKSDFYSIKLRTIVMFDTFELELYQSKEFIKMPTKYTLNEYMLNELKKQSLDAILIERMEKASKGKTYTRDEFKIFLKEHNFDLEHEWVKNTGIELGLGEKGRAFIAVLGIKDVEKAFKDLEKALKGEYKEEKAKTIATAEDIVAINNKLDESLKKYKAIPAK